MRGLVVGCGSIGQRHIRNLKSIGVADLAFVDPDAILRKVMSRQYGIESFDTLEEGILWCPDFAVIASPSYLHVTQAEALAKYGTHLFIEKPLSHSVKGLLYLEALVKAKNIVSMVGCNMRFYPGPAMVKEILDSGAIGRPMFARVYSGSYLPSWNKSRDYRLTYSANRSMGGGCLLDCTHEMDLASWLMGDVKEVFCLAGTMSDLEIDVEDVADLTCKHANGAVTTIHVDFAQRTNDRGLQIAGTEGSIFWDYNTSEVKFYLAKSDEWRVGGGVEGTNEMYIKSMSHFLDCIASGTETVNPISEAIKVMNIVFAAKRSIESGKMEQIL